ncbi:hypothetical protein RIF29_41915 [Crotalaria pallida]|uniref:Uncharacterized protein n=1 Tax=Crotalaria pallida TaxID=3830 RepID=A0AAN9E5Z2_CROPI
MPPFTSNFERPRLPWTPSESLVNANTLLPPSLTLFPVHSPAANPRSSFTATVPVTSTPIPAADTNP